MASFAKYSLVPTEEPKHKNDSKSDSSAFDYSSAFNYKSAFSYNSNNSSQYQSAFDYGYNGPNHSASFAFGNKDKKKKKSAFLECITTVVTGISCFLIAITFPCTLWFCLKKLQQWERLVVFRLGHLRGVLGPGIVFIIPWLDRHTRVDMRTKAFSVPPQQLITADNGIIEMGCEVKYRVSDVQQLTTSVTTPQHGLRSFGKTVMLNVLTKHTVRDMERDRLTIASEIIKELNARVFNWGIEIGEVDLSTVTILKEAEPNNPLKPILGALSNMQGNDGNSQTGPAVSAASNVGGMASLFDFSNLAKMSGLSGFQGFSVSGMDKKVKLDSTASGHYKINTDLIQLLDEDKVPSTNNNKQYSVQKSYQAKDSQVNGNCTVKSKLGKYLQNLVSGSGGADLSHGIYRLQVEGKDAGIYMIFIGNNGVRQVVEGELPNVTPDVSVVVIKEDLIAILEGSIPPLQAYLSGKLTVTGNLQLLMGLESLRQANLSSCEGEDIFIV